MWSFISGFSRWQAKTIEKQYENDRISVFYATVVCNTVLGLMAIIIAKILYVRFVDPTLITPEAVAVFQPMELGLLALFSCAYAVILRGHFKYGRAIISSTMAGSFLFSVFLTGGFPNTIVAPVLIVLPVIVYLLHGSKAGTRVAIFLPVLLIFQWALVKTGLLWLPDFTSPAKPTANKMISIILTYAAVVSVVASFQRQNHLLRRELAEERSNLARQANRDALTDLYNSRFFYAELERSTKQAFENNERLAILFLDLDNFKNINDSLGHPVGDGVLITVSERLLECVGENDVVARMGGDEFAVLMKSISSPDNIEELSDRLRQNITRAIVVHDMECHVGTSIGYSVYPDVVSSAQELLKSADHAMYRDKLRKLAREMQQVDSKDKNLPNDNRKDAA